MDWQLALEIFGLIGGIATLLGFFLVPALWIGSKIDALTTKINDEMKDFHGRLCDLEARRK